LKPDTKRWLTYFANKKILITGASGFIGSYLFNRLSECAEVHGTSRTKKDSNKDNQHWWQGTFDTIESSRELFQTIKPDIVFHLAGEVTAANELKYVLPTYHSLLTSTINLLTTAVETGCERVILTGSSTEPLSEDPIPNSPYAAAKWATTGYGHFFYRTYGLPVVIVRPFMGYGPGQPVYKLIPQVIKSLLNDESPKMSQGLWETDWIYIEDMIEGFLAAASLESPTGRVLDLGTGIITSVKGVVEKIVEIMRPKVKPLYGTLPDRANEHTRKADIEYSMSLLGWSATTSLEEGLIKTIDWYKQEIYDKGLR